MSEAVTAAPAAPAQNPGQSMPAPVQPRGHNTSGGQDTPKPAPVAPPPTPQAVQEYDIDGEKLTAAQIKEYKKTAMTAADVRKAAADKFREAAAQRKQLEDWATNFESDPFEATIQWFENRGTPRAQAENLARQKFENAYKTRYIEPEMMTPEQRDAAKWKAEAEAARKEKEDWQKQKQTEEQSVHSQAMLQATTKQIIDTIETHGLPKTPETVKKLAFYMNQNIKHGYDAPMEVVVQQVRDEEMGRTQHYAKVLEGEALVNWLGPEVIKKIRQYDLAQLKSKLKIPDQAAPSNSTNSNERQVKRPSDVDAYFRQLRMSKK